MALTLWAFAARRKICESVGEDLIKVKPSANAPVAWTKEELIRLILVCESQTGTFRTSGCPHSLFWKAWVLIGYETGIRMSDLMNLKTAQLRQNRLYVVHHKTGIPQGKLLSEEAVRLFRALSAINQGSGTVFRWALSRKHIFLHFKKLCKAAGLQGSTKYLRRTGATYCEIKQPGSAKRFLGHLSEGLATRYYIDPTLVSADCPRPPDLLSTEGLPVSDRCVHTR
jgi:integrase